MKKGFTLIELLAVIVILAIIALIAVPIVVNIINDSKTSSDEQTVELYLDTVTKTITKKQLFNSNFNPDKCIIQSNGDLDCYKANNKIETLKVDIEGEHPEKGTIELKDNKFIYKNILLNGKYYYERGILVEDADNNNKISIGDKYTYKVNDDDKFNFYVLSFNTDNTVNLIMDRNICEDGTISDNHNQCNYAWHLKNQEGEESDNRYGPDTAMIALGNGTRNWTNVLNINLNYSDADDNINSGYEIINDGYKGVTITDGVGYITKKYGTTTIALINNKPIKARLPKMKEVVDANCSIDDSGTSYGSCPIWLVENLIYTNVSNDKYSINKNNGITKIYGYWLLSSNPRSYYKARVVCFRGTLRDDGTSVVNDNGLRPVITVPISDLE